MLPQQEAVLGVARCAKSEFHFYVFVLNNIYFFKTAFFQLYNILIGC